MSQYAVLRSPKTNPVYSCPYCQTYILHRRGNGVFIEEGMYDLEKMSQLFSIQCSFNFGVA